MLMAGGCFPWDKKVHGQTQEWEGQVGPPDIFALKYCRPGAVPQRQATCLASPHLYENKAISEGCVETYLPITKHTLPTWTPVSCSKATGGSCRHFWYICSSGPALVWAEAQQWPQGSINCMLFKFYVWHLCTGTSCVASVYVDFLCGICVYGPAVCHLCT